MRRVLSKRTLYCWEKPDLESRMRTLEKEVSREGKTPYKIDASRYKTLLEGAGKKKDIAKIKSLIDIAVKASASKEVSVANQAIFTALRHAALAAAPLLGRNDPLTTQIMHDAKSLAGRQQMKMDEPDPSAGFASKLWRALF